MSPSNNSERFVAARFADAERVADAELFGEDNSDTRKRLLVSALQEFGKKGFHAATTRAIGEGAGMSPAGVYVRYAAKTDLLFAITWWGHRAALDVVERVLEKAGSDPAERVRGFIEAFALWHAENQLLGRVGQVELNALPEDQMQAIVKLRHKFDVLLRTEFVAGVEAGVFDIDDVNGTVTAALSLCIDLARWYEPKPKHTPQDVANLYADLVLRMVKAKAPAAKKRR